MSVIDHPQLQDGMRTHWADATMVDHMETAWAQASYDLVREREPCRFTRVERKGGGTHETHTLEN